MVNLDTLAPVMQRRARELQAVEPTVVYLSGRRDLKAQAHAMACNVVSDRHWIRKTYKRAATLQTAVDQHPEATTVAALEAVLYATLTALSPADVDAVSDHLRGNAVDLAPMEAAGLLTDDGMRVVRWIRACPDTKWFTQREGGKIRWHWSVHESAEV